MIFKTDFLYNYIKEAPLPLAMERTFECKILSQQEFARPILDIGCGEGIFAYVLFDEKIDVGIDPDKNELKRALKYGMYKELINCYGDSIDKPDKFFKTIFSNSVLEHIQGINPVLKEAHRLLDDDGVLYCTVPTNYFDKYSLMFQFLTFLKLKKLSEKYKVFLISFGSIFTIMIWTGGRSYLKIMALSLKPRMVIVRKSLVYLMMLYHFYQYLASLLKR